MPCIQCVSFPAKGGLRYGSHCSTVRGKKLHDFPHLTGPITLAQPTPRPERGTAPTSVATAPPALGTGSPAPPPVANPAPPAPAPPPVTKMAHFYHLDARPIKVVLATVKGRHENLQHVRNTYRVLGMELRDGALAIIDCRSPWSGVRW